LRSLKRVPPLSIPEPHVCAPIDANGNLTSDGTKTYFWNALNQLVEVKEGSTTVATFEYDGKGRRTEKTAGGLTRTYVYDAEDIVEERISGSSSDTIRYHHGVGIDEPLARTNGSSVTTYYLADHLGSVVQESSAAGAITLEREYDPWGELLQGSTTSGYAFTGREWDAETGLNFYRARYYDPRRARFLSEDSAYRAGNLYSCVANSPANRIDPSGHWIMFLPLVPAAVTAVETAVIYTTATLAGLAIAELIGPLLAKDTEADIDKMNEKAFDESKRIPKEPKVYPVDDPEDALDNIEKTADLIRRKSGRDPIETIDKSINKVRKPQASTPGGKQKTKSSCP
jgi:RHS repeat-associated protein